MLPAPPLFSIHCNHSRFPSHFMASEDVSVQRGTSMKPSCRGRCGMFLCNIWWRLCSMFSEALVAAAWVKATTPFGSVWKNNTALSRNRVCSRGGSAHHERGSLLGEQLPAPQCSTREANKALSAQKQYQPCVVPRCRVGLGCIAYQAKPSLCDGLLQGLRSLRDWW